MCEALCRLTRMERAGILLYDPASRAVRSVGSHGIDKAMIGEVEGTLDESPVALRALAEDRVISGELLRELPARYAGFAGITTLTCGPVAAGGRWLGIILADAGGDPYEIADEERETIHTLGRLAALAASVERATRQDERAWQLNERVELVRDIHERVMQRLFGLVLVLGSGEPLGEAERTTCHDELQAALADLRSALGRPLSDHGRPPSTTLRHLVERRAERMPGLAIEWAEGVVVPGRLERLAQSVFLEAVRNCEKHASAATVEVRVATAGEAFELEVVNDGVGGTHPGAGLGLRLLTLEALQNGALVEFGPLPRDRWHVRMVGSND